MERHHHSKATNSTHSRHQKINPTTSRHKKDPRLGSKSSKNLKTVGSKGQLATGGARELGLTSPAREQTNDYGVNPYFPKYKVKSSKKKDQVEAMADYGTFDRSRDDDRGSGQYASSVFPKLKLSNPRGVIDSNGKFISANQQQSAAQYSFRQQSTSKHSFSLNFTRQVKSKKKLNKSKSKSRQHDNKSFDLKCRSAGKSHHHSYYEQRPKKQNCHSKKSVKKKKGQEEPSTLASSQAGLTAMETVLQVNLTAESTLMTEIKSEISTEMESARGTIRKQRTTQAGNRQRLRCISMLSKICAILGMKRESHSLAIHYLDQYLMQQTPHSLKLLTLGCLMLAIKMDDSEMVTKFCLNYTCSPERTIKRNSSSQHMRVKREDGKDIRSKLRQILTLKISEDKKSSKEEFTIEQVFEFETQVMLKLGCRLNVKTITYWIDLFTSLWDAFVRVHCQQHTDCLTFRDERLPRNFSYLLQLVEVQLFSIGISSISKVSLVLGALYLVARVALQEKKEETPWEELCRYYRASLAKSTNLIFCDGVGINPLFVEFLSLLQLDISHIVDSVKMFSIHLRPECIRIVEWKRRQGASREDRLAGYCYNQDLTKQYLAN